jgi:hypothetical protein
LIGQLFGGSAFTKDYVLGLEDYSKATWWQNFIASTAGAVSSITVAAPLDTIKTRIQNANFETRVSGVVVIRDLLKNEGPSALFKGLTPKVCVLSFWFSENRVNGLIDLGRRTKVDFQLYIGADTYSIGRQIRVVGYWIRFVCIEYLMCIPLGMPVVIWSSCITAWYIGSVARLSMDNNPAYSLNGLREDMKASFGLYLQETL